MKLFIDPTTEKLREVLNKQSQLLPTYAAIGATEGEMPKGYRHDTVSVELGVGRPLFERCARHLETWGLQKSIGFSVFPADAAVARGENVLLSLSVKRLVMAASCRVIYVVNEDARRGFAYGTLPMHPESGEEYFGIHVDDNNAVTFEVRGFSRPRLAILRSAGPLTRLVQRYALRRYVTKMRALAAG